MKTSKHYPTIETSYYRPEIDKCLGCGKRLERSHTAWRKTISCLTGASKIDNQAYRCSDKENCPYPERVYRSAYADGLSMPYHTYGLDVLVYIGQQRLRQHRTLPEIHQALNGGQYEVQLSERHVENLFDAYLVLTKCSHGQRIEKYRAEIEANGGVVLAIDGAKPEKGQPGLYIFRDALSGCRLHSAVLFSADTESLAAELQTVAKLGLPVQAVISDDELATVAAVKAVFPDKPHGLCHIHFLKAAQRPVHEADQRMAKELKRPVRQLTKVERLLRHHPEVVADLSDSQQQALKRYLNAMRSVLLTKGKAPFRLAGCHIYEALKRLTDSLQRSAGEHEHPVLTRLQLLVHAYHDQQDTYLHVQSQQQWFLGLAELLDVPLTEQHQLPTLTGAEVAQAVGDYIDSLQQLTDYLQPHASFFQHLHKRLQQWAPGLFWTYEIPALPRTNNDLEIDIGNIKEQYRRITGRRTLKDYLMRYGPYLTFDDERDDPDELLRWFQQVDADSFSSEKAKLDAMREHLRHMYRFRQDPDSFLAETEQLWRDSS